MPAGFEKEPRQRPDRVDGGRGLKPLPNVVLKADYQWLRNRGADRGQPAQPGRRLPVLRLARHVLAGEGAYAADLGARRATSVWAPKSRLAIDRCAT